jgi:hypothetical protein
MSKTLATSRRSKRSPQSISLWRERPVSRFPSKESRTAWMTLVAALPFDSASWLASVAHDGSSGKTSPACSRLTAGVPSAPSSAGWPNSGMGPPTEFWTLNTSECPSDAAACSLSDIIETGDPPPQCFLTGHNIDRMKSRLQKYLGKSSELLAALNRYSDGLETKHRNSA